MSASVIRPSRAAVIGASLALLPTLATAQEVQRSALHDYRVVPVVTGLENPWAIAFLPGGDMLVTEKPGRLRIVRNGRLLPDAVPGVPAVRTGGQGGLLDVVPHPQFATNRLLYITYAKPSADGSQGTTALVRGRFVNDRLEDVQEVIEMKAWSQGRGHHGSRIAFDREGFLYVTIGDRQVPPRGDLERHPAQLLGTHHGKILRLHDDGRVPADNPFVGTPDALPEIWSYGHRSLQGLAVHPETGQLWETEHGPQGGDELNLIEKGKNYGWPVVGFGVNYGSGTAIHAATKREGMVDALNVWVPSIGTSGLAFYTGDKFPAWKGNVFAGGLVGQQLARLTLDGAKVVREETLLQGMGRIRDVRQGPDGFLYVAFDNRGEGTVSVARIEPVARR